MAKISLLSQKFMIAIFQGHSNLGRLGSFFESDVWMFNSTVTVILCDLRDVGELTLYDLKGY